MGRACGRAPRCSLLEARWLNAGSRLLGFVVGHRLDPALSVSTILLFQAPGLLDYVLDFGATKLIALQQRLSDALNIGPVVINKRLRAPLLVQKEIMLAR
jgi:hypothetical protein